MIGLGVLVYSMQYSMISIAIPDMIDELDTSLGTIGWVVSIYVVTQAIAMPIAGKISDQLGRREVYIFGLLAYGISSGACGLAPDSAILITGRIVQGVSAGILLPSSFGLISDWFSDRNRLQAVGLLSSVPPMGSIIGPSVGAAFVSLYNWRLTFLINPIIVIPLIVFAIFNIPGGKRQQSTARIDYLGSALLAVVIGALLLSLDRLGETGTNQLTLVVVALVAGVVGSVWFVRVESRAETPIVDMDLLRNRQFVVVNAINFFYGASNFGIGTFIPLYTTIAFGLSLAEAGFLLVARAIAVTAAGILTSFMLPRTGYRLPTIVGLTLMSVSLVGVAAGVGEIRDATGLSAEAVLLLLSVGLGVGHGIAGPATSNAALDIKPDQVASIMGLRGMFRFAGGAFGTTVIVAVTSRISSQQSGLEVAFIGLAGATALCAVLGVGVRDAPARLRRLARAS